jgi:hypothetical protein
MGQGGRDRGQKVRSWVSAYGVGFAKLIDSINSGVHLPCEDPFEGIGASAMEIYR